MAHPGPADEVSAARGCHLAWAADPDLPPGGFVVIRADGRVRFDQTFAGHHRTPAGNLAGRDRPAAVGGLRGNLGLCILTGFHTYAHVIYRPPHPNPLPPKRGEMRLKEHRLEACATVAQ